MSRQTVHSVRATMAGSAQVGAVTDDPPCREWGVMQQTFLTGPEDDPTIFEYDLSTKRVIIDAECGVFISDVIAFVNHMRVEHGIGLDLTPGPIVAVEDRERIEFIRRAALHMYQYAAIYEGSDFKGHDTEKAVRMAQELWNTIEKRCAKPEGL